MKRTDFIKHVDELIISESFSYPGDTETFGIGTAMGRRLSQKRIGINYEILKPDDRSSWPHAHSHDEELNKIFYPLHPKRNEECKMEGFLWENHPQHILGSHCGKSDLIRKLNNQNIQE